MKNKSYGALDRFSSSHAGRALILGLLALAMQFPVYKVDLLVGERESARTAATNDVAAKWGRAQRIAGPVLVLPYERSKLDPETSQTRTERCILTVLPSELNIVARTEHELRERGAFEVPLYTADLKLVAQFDPVELSTRLSGNETPLWQDAYVTLLVSDARAIQNTTNVMLNGDTLKLRAGAFANNTSTSGYHALVPAWKGDQSQTIEIGFRVNGSEKLRLSAMGDTSNISIESNWIAPRFEGEWLPSSREITATGFRALWSIPALARGFDSSQLGLSQLATVADRAAIGVDYITPIDPYRMTERSTKYSLLFIVLTFTAMWLYEVLLKLRIHYIQYFLTAAALCLFYLLLLSISEHVGFAIAYAVASSAIVAMLVGYAMSLLGKRRRALAMGSGIGLLYGYLYTLLQEKNYALLSGSIGLFVILAGIMFVTRNVRWSSAIPANNDPTEAQQNAPSTVNAQTLTDLTSRNQRSPPRGTADFYCPHKVGR